MFTERKSTSIFEVRYNKREREREKGSVEVWKKEFVCVYTDRNRVWVCECVRERK